jgi:hypothetical protein
MVEQRVRECHPHGAGFHDEVVGFGSAWHEPGRSVGRRRDGGAGHAVGGAPDRHLAVHGRVMVASNMGRGVLFTPGGLDTSATPSSEWCGYPSSDSNRAWRWRAASIAARNVSS